jgi:transcriptional regulator with AAA-type ATPase domain
LQDGDRDYETTVPRSPDEGVARVRRVVVLEGPDAGRHFVLDPDAPLRILLGTSEVCDLRLTDPTVSRRHAAFEAVGLRYRITDLGSTNGTFVDGVSVLAAFVRGGEVVRCGSTALRLDGAPDLARAAEGRVAAGPSQRPAPVDPRGSLAPAAHPSGVFRFGSMLGASVAMRRLHPLCERLAKSRVPVVIEGETGTGKEVLAESFHEVGGARGPFVVFDCTTVSANLVEAELFGHERGAFTGATTARAGVFEEADGGTLLVDEVGDLEPTLQAKLLRALDRGEVRRVGGSRWIKVDVRVIAATRRDLDKAVSQGRFRDDLFHRLAVARIELPPLRERHGDVALLARQFAVEMGGSPDDVEREIERRFSDYGWPGNVRELRNAVARYIALGDDWQAPRSAPPPSPGAPPLVEGGRSADWIDAIVSSKMPYPVARRRTLDEFERRYIERVLAEHGGNVAHAAKASGLALRYFRLVKARRQGKP